METTLKLQGALTQMVEAISHFLAECKENKRIRDYEKRQVTETMFGFGITLISGDGYDIYVSSPENTDQNSLLAVSPTIDSLVIGQPQWIRIPSAIKFIRTRILAHERWFMLKAKVYVCLQKFITSDQNDFLKSVEKDKGGADFLIECAVKNKTFTFCFNITDSKRLILLKRKRKKSDEDYHPTIFSVVEELRHDPTSFIQKVSTIKDVMYRKKFSSQRISPQLLHIISY